MTYELLGELQADPRFDDTLIGSIEFGDSTIRLSIEIGGQDKEAVFQFAEEIVSRIDHFVALASKHAAAKLLSSYNEDWRHYSASDGKGGFVDVTEPELDAEGFSGKLSVSGVTICGETICEIWFSDGGMFAGHSVSVSSFDGAKFEKLDASLFG